MLVYERCGHASAGVHIMFGALRVALLSSSVIVAASPVKAQDGDARRGLAIARETCSVCHGVRKGERSPNASAPAFDVVAAVPGMTGLALQSMLQTSHREMPNLILQSDERADLIAYILSLRAN
jgi:mono/diheme cytochrome c family protein